MPVHLAVHYLVPDGMAAYRVDLAPLIVQANAAGAVDGLPASNVWRATGLVWILGVGYALARLLAALEAGRRLVRESSPATDQDPALLADVGLTRFAIRWSGTVHTPTVAGLFRPTLLLPVDFVSRYRPQERRLILIHEACHMRRRDNLATAAARVCTALFWFNPLVHVAYRAFRADQELSCDARVLRHARKGERKAYGRALVKSAVATGPAAVTSSWQDPNQLKERTVMLKSHRHSAARSLTGLCALASLSLGAATLSVGAFATDQAAKAGRALTRGAVLVDRAPPGYPADAAQEKIEGRVVMQFTVDTEGRVKDVRVVKSEPDARFDDVAVAAVKQWRFEPAIRDGEPVPVQTEQAIKFELD